jgi:hypothetical protein
MSQPPSEPEAPEEYPYIPLEVWRAMPRPKGALEKTLYVTVSTTVSDLLTPVPHLEHRQPKSRDFHGRGRRKYD